MKTGTIAEIYDLLVAGKTLEFRFSIPETAYSFRSQLHNYRKQVADSMKALGESTEKEENELSFKITPDSSSACMVVRIQLVKKKEATFSFAVVDDYKIEG